MIQNDMALITESIWSMSSGQYGFVVNKNHSWKQVAIDTRFPVNSEVFLQGSGEDLYFTPLTYNDTARRVQEVAPGRVVWVDHDGGAADMNWDHMGVPQPSILWTTSLGRWQALWFLKDTLPGCELAQVSRALAYKTGGDKGAWDAARVLRVPGSTNYKRGGVPAQLLFYAPWITYSLDDLNLPTISSAVTSVSTAHPDIPSRSTWKQMVLSHWKTLPLSSQYWITLSADSFRRRSSGVDRSVIIWDLANSLHRSGFSPEDIFFLLWYSPVNKYKDRPEALWTTACRAAA